MRQRDGKEKAVGRGGGFFAKTKTHVELPLLRNILFEKFGVKKLMIAGGPMPNWHMLHERLVDEIQLIHLPFIDGGADTPLLVVPLPQFLPPLLPATTGCMMAAGQDRTVCKLDRVRTILVYR